MTLQVHPVTTTPDADPQPALRILRAIPPEPRSAPGTYDVQLELTRPLTVHERRALAQPGRRLVAIGAHLVVGDTTLERVAEHADELAHLVLEVETEGARLELEARQRARARAARAAAEEERLCALAASIRFCDPAAPEEPRGATDGSPPR